MRSARSLAGTFLAALVLSASARGADEGVRFDHLTVESGLSHNFVQSILKDSRGFLWFGTQDGLDRYDGASFRVYRHDPQNPSSLPTSVVGVLLEDSKKRLWVGSGWGNTGVALYERERDTFKRFDVKPGGANGNNVRAIAEDRHGQLWLGTDNGIARLDSEKGTVERFPLLADSRAGEPGALVTSLFNDSQDRLWVGSGAGLLQFDRRSGKYRRWPGRADDPMSLARADVWDFYEDDEGLLWIATLGSGLHHLDVGTGSDVRYLPDARDARSISHARVTRLVPDGRGRLYVGTENGGLNILDLRTRKFVRYLPDPADDTTLSSGSIWSLCLDDQGILWIGTFNGGINVLSPLGQRFRQIRARRGGLNDPHVSAVMQDRRGNLWIGTDGGGLNRRDAKTGVFTYYRHDPKDPTTIGSDAVWALLEDSQGNLWVGGWDGGLGLIDPASGRVTRFRNEPGNPASLVSNHIWRILELSTGEMLIATQAGADLFDRASRRFTRLTARYPGAGQDVIYSAAEDAQGNLWLVGNIFVGHVDRKSGAVTRYQNDPQDPNSLGRGWTQAVRIDSAGNVWLGTEGGLSCVVASSKKLRRYTQADGLPNDTVTSFQEDGSGNLWLATNRGIAKLADAIHVPEKPRFLSFDVHDGLQSFEFARNASFLGKDGEMYFGGPRGLNAFFPAQIEQNLVPPPVVFTDLRISNRPVPIGAAGSPLARSMPETDALTLSPSHSVVTFEFAALNYLLPQKNQYAYRLEGFEEQWNYVGTQRTATYTNLSQGRYTLHVQAANNDGVWNEAGATLKLRVLPPWYKAPWFLLVSGVALVAGLVWGYRVRVRSIEERRRELEGLVQARTADLQKEIGEHQRTEHSLQDQIVERQRAEGEARETAGQLAAANEELVGHQRALQEKQEALEHENEERGRAEEQARLAAERIAAANAELVDKQRALEEKQGALEHENEERRRAEEQARLAAERIAAVNAELVENQRALQEKQLALERENEERRRAEEAAGRERDLLHALMENIPDRIYFKDAESRYTRINKAHAAALGLTDPEGAVGKSDFDFHPADFARVTREEERELLSLGHPLLGKVEREARSGRWLLATKVPIRNAVDQIVGLVGISKDITERKEAEERLERELAALLGVVSTVAQGDLTRRGAEGDDTLGRIARSINAMAEAFAAILGEVRDMAWSVSSASAEILGAAGQIAKGAQYGSDQVYSTTTAVEQMAVSMVRVSKNAERSASVSAQVLDHVREGGRSVNATSQGIERIDAAVSETAVKMRLLEKRGQEIFEIIELIQEIASRSELLSLNAAIEAAHAGDAGRGFGVVAEEIRRLADRSNEATAGVSRIVEGVVDEIRAVLAAMQNGMQEVRSGRDLSDQAQRSLREIEALVQESAQVAGEISLASREQTQATDTVAQAMRTIAGITGQSSAGAGEATKAVQDLVALSEHLNRALSRFKIDRATDVER